MNALELLENVLRKELKNPDLKIIKLSHNNRLNISDKLLAQFLDDYYSKDEKIKNRFRFLKKDLEEKYQLLNLPVNSLTYQYEIKAHFEDECENCGKTEHHKILRARTDLDIRILGYYKACSQCLHTPDLTFLSCRCHKCKEKLLELKQKEEKELRAKSDKCYEIFLSNLSQIKIKEDLTPDIISSLILSFNEYSFERPKHITKLFEYGIWRLKEIDSNIFYNTKAYNKPPFSVHPEIVTSLLKHFEIDNMVLEKLIHKISRIIHIEHNFTPLSYSEIIEIFIKKYAAHMEVPLNNLSSGIINNLVRLLKKMNIEEVLRAIQYSISSAYSKIKEERIESELEREELILKYLNSLHYRYLFEGWTVRPGFTKLELLTKYQINLDHAERPTSIWKFLIGSCVEETELNLINFIQTKTPIRLSQDNFVTRI